MQPNYDDEVSASAEALRGVRADCAHLKKLLRIVTDPSRSDIVREVASELMNEMLDKMGDE